MIRALSAILLAAVLVAGCSSDDRDSTPPPQPWTPSAPTSGTTGGGGSSAPSQPAQPLLTVASWDQPGAGPETYYAEAGPGSTRVWWGHGAKHVWRPAFPVWDSHVKAELASTVGPVTSQGLADLPEGWEVAFIAPQSAIYCGPSAPICSGYVDSQRRLIVITYQSRKGDPATDWRLGGTVLPALATALDLAHRGLDGAIRDPLGLGFVPAVAPAGVAQVPAFSGWSAPVTYRTIHARYATLRLPSFCYEHPDWAPAIEAELIRYIDETPNEKGAKTLADKPGATVVVVGPGSFSTGGIPVAGTEGNGTLRCSLATGRRGDGVALPVFAHEQAHWHGWAGHHPATCATCQVSAP